MDTWLHGRALSNEESGASRTFVLCAGKSLVGYYCLANGAVLNSTAVGRVRRGMPKEVPVMVIGRLAIDRNWQGVGLGRALLRDAVLRTLQASQYGGIRAVVVHAISERAKRFYKSCGFLESKLEPMTLMISLKDAVRALKKPEGEFRK